MLLRQLWITHGLICGPGGHGCWRGLPRVWGCAGAVISCSSPSGFLRSLCNCSWTKQVIEVFLPILLSQRCLLSCVSLHHHFLCSPVCMHKPNHGHIGCHSASRDTSLRDLPAQITKVTNPDPMTQSHLLRRTMWLTQLGCGGRLWSYKWWQNSQDHMWGDDTIQVGLCPWREITNEVSFWFGLIMLKPLIYSDRYFLVISHLNSWYVPKSFHLNLILL